MNGERRTPFARLLLLAVMAWCVSSLNGGPVFAEAGGASRGLADQVNQLATDCQGAESFSVDQLRETLARADSLNDAVIKSDLERKKLLLIRLQKSRNLCTYFLQLKQKE